MGEAESHQILGGDPNISLEALGHASYFHASRSGVKQSGLT